MASDFQSVLTKSYTGQNILNIGISEDCSPNYKDYLPRYIVFMTMAPGTTGETRGYDFNRKITLKSDLDKLMALAQSLKLCSQYIIEHGQISELPTFSIFTDPSKSSFGSGGGLKLLKTSIFESKGKLNVALSVKEGDGKPFGLFWSAAEAMAVGMSIEKLAAEGMAMDIKYKKDHPYRPAGSDSGPGKPSSRPSAPSGSDPFGGDFGPPPDENDMPF